RPFEDGRWGLLARGTGRIEVVEWLDDAPYPAATVCDRPDVTGSKGGDAPAIDAAIADAAGAVARARALAAELGRPLDTAGSLEEAPEAGATSNTPEDRLWRLCAAAPLGPFDRQRLLEADGPTRRAALLTDLASALADDLAALL
ncbi:MAG TPA: LON peptidase substrate-binding domain-containing protein, partial [Acidimicrobiales bacterium]|nr:LON peptidase substrate-binding domain-containing protein [Acidimicrobiales bacterium]